MTVYVDVLKDNGWHLYGKSIKNCHMWSENKDELLSFGAILGLRSQWLQNSRGFIHFDLTPKKREMAVKNGAVECKLIPFIRRKQCPNQ
jgi:hypothetical protein